MCWLKLFVYVSVLCYCSRVSLGGKLKILTILPFEGLSHFNVIKPLLVELGKRGHHITVISHFPHDQAKDPLPNYRDINLADSSDNASVNVMDLNNFTSKQEIGIFFEVMSLSDWGLDNCRRTLNHPQVKKLIRSNEKFDLIITEAFNSDCTLGFVHKFQAPFISLAAHKLFPWVHQRFGNIDNPSYMPTVMNAMSHDMNFLQRAFNSLTQVYMTLIYNYLCIPQTQKLVDEAFGPGVPPLLDIARETSAVLVNTHYSLHGFTPTVPNVVQIGGIHIKGKVNPLPKDIQQFLDSATEGALLFSWGSMIKASTLPPEKLNHVLKVISELPRRVLWKWEVNELPGKPKNLMVKKWLPQFDILSKFLLLNSSNIC